jgi:hypothetical protein
MAGTEDETGDASGVTLSKRLPRSGVRPVLIDCVDVESEVDLPTLVVVQGDVHVLGIQERAEDLVDAPVELVEVLRAAREVGDAIQRGLRLRRRRLPLDLCLERGDASLQGRVGGCVLFGRDAGSSLGEVRSTRRVDGRPGRV